MYSKCKAELTFTLLTAYHVLIRDYTQPVIQKHLLSKVIVKVVSHVVGPPRNAGHHVQPPATAEPLQAIGDAILFNATGNVVEVTLL